MLGLCKIKYQDIVDYTQELSDVIPQRPKRIVYSISQISLSLITLGLMMDNSKQSVFDKTIALIEPDITGGIEVPALMFLTANGIYKLYQECTNACVSKVHCCT